MECPYQQQASDRFVCPQCGDVRTKRVRRNCPAAHRGLGDTIARLLRALGVKKHCAPCEKRRAALNWLFPYRADRWQTRIAHAAQIAADIPRWLVGRPARRPRILHVCRTLGTACGVANFARNLHDAALCAGASIDSLRHASGGEVGQYDVALIQHEHAFYLRHPEVLEQLSQQLEAVGVPRVLLLHSPVAEFDRLADAYVVMCDGMVETSLPVYRLPHPAHVLPAADRRRLREHLGLDRHRLLLGSHGFITPSRRFAAFVERLAPVCRSIGGALLLAVADHARSGRAMQDARERLLRAARRHSDCVVLVQGFRPADDVNLLMQACDLVWCWTSVRSRPYASGVASDLYGSGTRLVVPGKQQHAAVLGRPNVVAGPDEFEPFADLLEELLRGGEQPRHDPRDLSWETQLPGLLDFLAGIAK